MTYTVYSIQKHTKAGIPLYHLPWVRETPHAALISPCISADSPKQNDVMGLVMEICIWRVRILMSKEQKMAIFSLLYDEQMCNWLRVVHLPDIFILVCVIKHGW